MFIFEGFYVFPYLSIQNLIFSKLRKLNSLTSDYQQTVTIILIISYFSDHYTSDNNYYTDSVDNRKDRWTNTISKSV